MTSMPSSAVRIVAAPMTLLIPGAGPPPTRIASFLWCSPREFPGFFERFRWHAY
jgi:hypothetical protein